MIFQKQHIFWLFSLPLAGNSAYKFGLGSGSRINTEHVPDTIKDSTMTETNPRSTTDGESEYGPFIASKKRQHFHRQNCKWAAYLTPQNSIEFSSHREAVEAGKK